MERKQAQRRHSDSGEDVETTSGTESVDTTEVDELLEEIDEVLDEQAVAEEARKKDEFKKKLEKYRTINFIARRAQDPCANAVRLPGGIAEQLVDAGLAKEVDCGDC